MTVVTQCELIGNPVDESLGAAQRESLPFANMVAEFRKAHGESIELKLMTGSADQVVRPYPDAGGTGRHRIRVPKRRSAPTLCVSRRRSGRHGCSCRPACPDSPG